MRQGYFWPTLVEDSKNLVRKCESCQKFGVPRILISDNGTQFQDKKIREWCKELKVAQHFTAVANPQANGQTEVTNRTILQHLKTRLEGKGSWVDELPGVLWAYLTTPRTATGETPFCLVYGTEAIIPAEIGRNRRESCNTNPRRTETSEASTSPSLKKRGRPHMLEFYTTRV
ncbi:UNVERIFIED_CONTAM: Gag-Pol polyprotein [Sesamum indicum]